MTEGEVLDILEARFSKIYTNGDYTGFRYVFARHVRSKAGFDASNTFDGVVVDTWESSGLLFHIFEVKISRSDWLRELATPAKTQAAVDAGDTFSVVAPHGVVKVADLREGWGWYEINNGKVRCKRKPTQHRKTCRRVGMTNLDYVSVDRSFVVAMMRAIKRWDDKIGETDE